MSNPPPNQAQSRSRFYLVRILALLFVLALSAFIFSIRQDAAKLAFLGYPGVFLIAFMAYATVILPAPALAIIFTFGGVLSNPLAVAISASLGATLGEISGYLAGFGGQVVIERLDIYQRLTFFMQRHGPITVYILSAIPNPFFDLAGMAAGALKMPLHVFLFWCFLGQTTKMLIFSFLGAGLLSRFLH
ncbi:MAG: VTT domain-containing protein [Anaerolineales bacterium]|nr:VTT domain-containing protein [Anaerolineales bacterium]MDW8447959.1 VTT domain-containing protein [Anaerolineales bacterium]